MKLWIKRWIGWVLAALVVAAFVGFLAMLFWPYNNSVDEENIKRSLAPGSTVDQINGFLDSEGIEHSGLIRQIGDFSRLESTGYPPSTPVLIGIVRKSGGFSLVQEDTYIFFVLDQNERVVNYIFEKVATGF